MTLVTEKRIRSRTFFEQADRDTFELLVGLLKSQGCVIGDRREGLQRLMPFHDKALWQPDYQVVYDRQSRKSIEARHLVHQGMHALIACRYGNKLKGKPTLTLLSEGLASTTDMYYDLQFVRNGGNPMDSFELPFYQRSARQLNTPYVRKFNSMAKDPFAAFKECALSSFEISKGLFDMVRETSVRGRSNANRLVARLKESDNYVFLHHRDFPNFSLFTATYCGFNSTKEDRDDSANCIKVLNQSRSMPDFLIRLGIKDYIEDGDRPTSRA